MSKRLTGLLAVLVVALTWVGQSAAHHGEPGGHLPPVQRNVDLMSKLQLSNVIPGRVTDVATYRDTAYLGAWFVSCPGGFWSVDISNPRNPKELGYTSAPAGTYQTEGMHAFRLTTPTFTGDVLLVSNETCSEEGKGGVSLYDVTNPANPTPLFLQRGDEDIAAGIPNDSHSAFGWDAGDKAYVVMTDNAETGTTDVDIMDITDPRNPVLIKETGIGDWPAAQDNLAFGEQAFVHDMVVRRVEGKWELLLSYWDAGYVRVDVTDPANPVYISDSDYPATDPFTGLLPEGNGHEAEFDRCPEEGVRSRFPCGDVRYILGADEDFGVSRPLFEVTGGADAGQYGAGEFGFTPPIASTFADNTVNGTVVFGGSGCPDDPTTPEIEGDLNENGIEDRAEVPTAPATPAGEESIIVFTRGECFFSDKIRSGEETGWDVVIIGNHHTGSGEGLFPNAFICGSQGSDILGTAPALCVGHRAMHLMFNQTPEYTTPGFLADLPAIGTTGVTIQAQGGVFDAWGYLNLIDAETMQHIDHYAIPEALDPRYSGGGGFQQGPGGGFGDLTVHEITTDPTGDVGYLAWYSGGLRVVDYSGGDLQEVGAFIDPEGSNFWGVELNVRRDGRLFILNSDRDYGLYIFRFGTDLTTRGSRRRGTVGRPVTFSATVHNSGTIAESNTKWTARLPRGLRALSARRVLLGRSVSAAPARCTIRGRTVTCNLGRLPENASARISVRVRPTRVGTMRAKLKVGGIKAEYDVGNNTGRVTIRARRAAVARTGIAGLLTGRP
jgi:hypothetical protein